MSQDHYQSEPLHSRREPARAEEVESGWTPCSSGEMHRIAGDHRARQRREKMMHVANRGAWGLLVVAVACWSIGVTIGGIPHISCAECEAQFAALEAHFLGKQSLPEDALAQVAHHMHNCNYCPAKFEILHPEAAENQQQLLEMLQQFTRHNLSQIAIAATILP